MTIASHSMCACGADFNVKPIATFGDGRSWLGAQLIDNRMDLSTDGERILMVGTNVWGGLTHYQESVCVWSREGKLITAKRCSQGRVVRSCAISNDGEVYACAYDELVEVRSCIGEELLTTLELPAHHFIMQLAFSPDGNALMAVVQLSASERLGGVFVWRWKAESSPSRIDGYGCACFSPQSDIVWLATSGFIHKWSVAETRILTSLSTIDGTPSAICVDNSGRRLLFALGEHVFVRSGDDKEGGEVLKVDCGSSVCDIAFSQDLNGAIVCGNDASVVLIAADGKSVKRLRQGSHPDEISGVCEDGFRPICLSQDGRVLVGTGHFNRSIQAIDVRTGRFASPARDRHDSAAICLSRDGDVVVSLEYDGCVRAWDIKSGQKILEKPLVGAAHSYGGYPCEQVAVGEHRHFHFATKDRVGSLGLDGRNICGRDLNEGGLVRIALSDGGRCAVAQSREAGAVIEVFSNCKDVDSKEFEAGRLTITSLAMPGEGRHVVYGNEAGGVGILDLGANERRTRRLHFREVWGVSADAGVRVVGSVDEVGRCIVFDVAQEKPLFDFDDEVYCCISVSSDGRRAVAGTALGGVRGFCLEGDGLVAQDLRRVHLGEVTCVSFSHDGGRVATASADGTIGVYDWDSLFSE